jgi:hypothetical protein
MSSPPSHIFGICSNPGDTVVQEREQSVQADCVLSAHEKVAKGTQNIAGTLQGMSSMLLINCFYIGYNGEIFGPVAKAFTIRHFHGKRLVISLPIIPMQCLEEDEIQKLLIMRGSMFSLFSTPRYQSYASMAID